MSDGRRTGPVQRLAVGVLALALVSCGDAIPNGDSWDEPETLQSVIDSSPVIVRGSFRGGTAEVPVLLEGNDPIGRETVIRNSFETGRVYRGEPPAEHFVVPTVVKRRLFEPGPGEHEEAVFDAVKFVGGEYILFLRQPDAGYGAAFQFTGPVAAARIDGDQVHFEAPDSYREKWGEEAIGPSFDVTLAELEAAIEAAEDDAIALRDGQANCGDRPPASTSSNGPLSLFESPLCVAWEAHPPGAESYDVVVHYIASGEWFRYQLAGTRRALQLPAYEQPSCARGEYTVYLSALRGGNTVDLGGVGGRGAC